jgi:oxygen-independent coproporphyrinogen-3 oxidase
MNGIEFDSSLISKYDVNGPRYTSYPTANEFIDGFSASHYIDALEQLDTGGTVPLSMYIHVPFCATICYYCACNKIVTANRKHAHAYLERLLAEIRLKAALLPENHRVEQLHFGGGTPTYFTNEQLASVFAALHEHCNLATDDERDFSIEIDPRSIDADRVRFLSSLGMNRMSVGIQDFDPLVQRAVNRIQSEVDTATVINAARENAFKSISVDLIYGLPLQTVSGFEQTLARVLRLDPDRISLYSYAHLPKRFKTQRQINSADLPNPATKLELLKAATDVLDRAGMVYVGMDHFAKPTDTLVRSQQNGTLHRNFQGYTTHGHCELIGLGVSAISSIGGIYCQNAKDLKCYNKQIDQHRLPIERGIVLSADDLIRRELISTLMCHFKLDVAAFENRFGLEFRTYFETEWEALKTLQDEGLLSLSDTCIEVTPKGRFLIRNICMTFDAYIAPQQSVFSRAI